MEPKLLLFDIENSPSLAYIWGLKNDYVPYEFVESEWYIMCWAAKWLGQKKIYSSALPDFPRYNKDPTNDRDVVLSLWKLLDEADVVIAHNGKYFDVRKFNAKCVYHKISPPSPYRIIDTLMVARKHFMFTSNRLGDIGKYLGVGEKIQTGGFGLWRDCMNRSLSAWKRMVKYCKGDVLLLERVYEKLRPYMPKHPNLAVFRGDGSVVCPKCGSEKVQKRGFLYTNTSRYRRFQCIACGGWGREKNNLVERKTATVGA